MATKKYKCKVCGYIHEGNTAPDFCPVCKVPSTEFDLVKDAAEKKGFFSNTSSDGYTVFYAAVMVILVAAVLAFTALLLKEKQQKNIEIDKKIQILSALHLASDATTAEKLYNEHVVASYIVTAIGEKRDVDGFSIDIATEFKKPVEIRELPVYECKSKDGSIKYVLPVYGAGLWGPIWGYVCLNNDMNTVFGAYFTHKGETPGLGAEIDKPFFQEQFVGKSLSKDGVFKSIAIMKKGQTALNDEDQVDAISGGTITSKGVEVMLKESLHPYDTFLKSKGLEKSTITPAATLTPATPVNQ